MNARSHINPASPSIRLQKYLAQSGVASRRASEHLIRDGRIAVNGTVVTTLGTRITPGRDIITTDGVPVAPASSHRTIRLYKPRGYICSASSQQGKTVFSLLNDIDERLFPVGRLDKDSEGLLLLTNDGELANRLTHPRYTHHKCYRVTVSGSIDDSVLQKLNHPMTLDGYCIRPARVSVECHRRNSGKTVLRVELQEGRNRQIRNMCAATGLTVHRLVRTQLSALTLGTLKPGQWRDLTPRELAMLQQQ